MRAAKIIAWAFAISSALAGFAFVVWSFVHRPDNAVEAELSYETLRVARGLPLYVDPSIGAIDAGAPPSRYYVLYTPFWPWLVGHVASPSLASIHLVGRTVSVLAWAAMLTIPIVFARRQRRADTVLAALVASGLFFLSRNAPSATPDTIAAALACGGLVRAARRGAIDPLAAILLVAAPFAKPSCVGISMGCALVHLSLRPPRWLRTCGVALATAALLVLACHVASDGAWLVHIARSTGQPLSLSRWVSEQGGRVFVLGAPHLAIAIVAWARGASRMTILPLLTSVAWSSFAMAKHGSGTHYWLEPTAAAIVAVAFMPATRERLVPAVASTVGAVVAAIVSVLAYPAELASYRAHDSAIAALARHCVRASDEVVASSDIGIELALNGRFLVPTWQSSMLIRRDRFPLEAWRRDLHDDHVRWLVAPFDIDAPLDARTRADTELSAYLLELRDVVTADFAFDARVAGQWVYRRRGDTSHAPRAGAPCSGETRGARDARLCTGSRLSGG
jgi:hypothetical protein